MHWHTTLRAAARAWQTLWLYTVCTYTQLLNYGPPRSHLCNDACRLIDRSGVAIRSGDGVSERVFHGLWLLAVGFGGGLGGGLRGAATGRKRLGEGLCGGSGRCASGCQFGGMRFACGGQSRGAAGG